jgi:uncharacterized membrane protein
MIRRVLLIAWLCLGVVDISYAVDPVNVTITTDTVNVTVTEETINVTIDDGDTVVAVTVPEVEIIQVETPGEQGIPGPQGPKGADGSGGTAGTPTMIFGGRF